MEIETQGQPTRHALHWLFIGTHTHTQFELHDA